MVHLGDRDEVLAYARSHYIPVELANSADAPLHLTKRGCLIWARKCMTGRDSVGSYRGGNPTHLRAARKCRYHGIRAWR
jgi:hypothetical protein